MGYRWKPSQKHSTYYTWAQLIPSHGIQKRVDCQIWDECKLGFAETHSEPVDVIASVTKVPVVVTIDNVP